MWKPLKSLKKLSKNLSTGIDKLLSKNLATGIVKFCFLIFIIAILGAYVFAAKELKNPKKNLRGPQKWYTE